jgi:putative two-component system response regulator
MESKMKILIADDSEMNREILKDILGDKYEILTAKDGEETIFAIQKYGVSIQLLLLDIIMPKMDGLEVLAFMNKHHLIDDIPVVIISTENTPSVMQRAYDLGVYDYISRPFDAPIVKRRVSNAIEMYAKQRRLINVVAEKISESENNNNMMVAILSHIVEFRNLESGMHTVHINAITRVILETLVDKTDVYNLSHHDIAIIGLASALHDIGKISIPDYIINKPDKLTAEEAEIMKTHTESGAKILESVPYKDEELIKYAKDICRWHHERYDGNGYPDKLVGDEIPIWAQVVSVADAYDALTSDRVYRKAYSHEEAMKMIMGGECGVFNPLLLECLKEAEPKIKAELSKKSIDECLISKENMRDLIFELSKNKDLAPSEHALELLERERIKNEFYAVVSRDAAFEYYYDSQIAILTKDAAELFGTDEAVMNPLGNPKIGKRLSKDDVERLAFKIKNAPQDDPIVSDSVDIKEVGKCKVYARAIWSQDGDRKLVGIIGKIGI